MNIFSRPIAALISFGEATRFCGRIVMKVFNGRVLGFIGETLRQAGILITGSAVIVLGLVFILGLQCGIEGAYAAKSVGATSSTGAIAALCDLREVIPYAFGYMMAAKVGTGFVAEIGSMRISDEIDALEVMGFDSILYLGSTRLLGTWLVLPFLYMIAVAVGFAASYLRAIAAIGRESIFGQTVREPTLRSNTNFAPGELANVGRGGLLSANCNNTGNVSQVPLLFGNVPCRVQPAFNWGKGVLSAYFPHVRRVAAPK
jgi:ABC-type transporter Mla maintaining outer membrane lipid asymmetry permease subunit MlaE